MKMKTPPQPLVFVFRGPTALCAAVSELYRMEPRVASSLCVWRGKYFLQVGAGLCRRSRMAQKVEQYGECLGASPVLYAFCREHGQEISQDAVAQLGKALTQNGRPNRAAGKKNGPKRKE